jgi:hypothetical protein
MNKSTKNSSGTLAINPGTSKLLKNYLSGVGLGGASSYLAYKLLDSGNPRDATAPLGALLAGTVGAIAGSAVIPDILNQRKQRARKIRQKNTVSNHVVTSKTKQQFLKKMQK